MAWCCPKCTAETLSFHYSDDNELFLKSSQSSNIFSKDLEFIPRQGFNEFMNAMNNDEEHEAFPNSINSRYHEINLFNQIYPEDWTGFLNSMSWAGPSTLNSVLNWGPKCVYIYAFDHSILSQNNKIDIITSGRRMYIYTH